MKITEFLAPDAVVSSLTATDKPAVVAELCEVLCRHAPAASAQNLPAILLERELLSSTGIGEGVAIPHGKVTGLPGLVAAFGVSRRGIDFNSIDGKPTQLFFALLAPENSAGIHLKALARISRIFKNPAFRRSILDASDAHAIYDIISAEDSRT
ncbi:MAG: PTS sugar transporter subunit IIA [Myxococcales bacterium]|jgi:PTS system nitrogen regulatory IIA component|nr:PTS sugar transporter subunit IIA [Myxococcales bacterium]